MASKKRKEKKGGFAPAKGRENQVIACWIGNEIVKGALGELSEEVLGQIKANYPGLAYLIIGEAGDPTPFDTNPGDPLPVPPDFTEDDFETGFSD